jgi:hypothetical protein
MLSMMVSRKLSAISMSMTRRGWMMPLTSSRKVLWKLSPILLDLVDHLLVDLIGRRKLTRQSKQVIRVEPGTNLERVDLEVEVLVLDQAVDALRQDALDVALSRASASVGGHHSRDGRVGTQQGSELGGSLKLGREDRL